MSLEILNNNSCFGDLWGKATFVNNLVNLVLDEAHVVQEWGGTFCSDYLHIGPIHYLITWVPTTDQVCHWSYAVG